MDTGNGRVLSELTFPVKWKNRLSGFKSYGLCLTNKNEAAVALSNKVQFFNIEGESLNMGTVLTLNHDSSLDISTCGDRDLVVSYNKAPWLEVISPDGSVLHQIRQNGTTSHFKCPGFLTTSVDGYIYVSDRGTDEITKLNSSLQLLQTFSNRLLSAPRGIISISPDQLLVCSCCPNSIVLLNTSSGKSSILLGKQYGSYMYMTPFSSLDPWTVMSSILLGDQDEIKRPICLSYSPEQEKLYVNGSGRLNVYKLSKCGSDEYKIYLKHNLHF